MIDLLIPEDKTLCSYCKKRGDCICSIVKSTVTKETPEGMKRAVCDIGVLDFVLFMATCDEKSLAYALKFQQKAPVYIDKPEEKPQVVGKPQPGEALVLISQREYAVMVDSAQKWQAWAENMNTEAQRIVKELRVEVGNVKAGYVRQLNNLNAIITEQRKELSRLHKDRDNFKKQMDELYLTNDTQARIIREKNAAEIRERVKKALGIPESARINAVDFGGMNKGVLTVHCVAAVPGRLTVSGPPKTWKDNKVEITVEKTCGQFCGIKINGVEVKGATGYSLVGDQGIMPCVQVEFGCLPQNILLKEEEGKQ